MDGRRFRKKRPGLLGTIVLLDRPGDSGLVCMVFRLIEGDEGAFTPRGALPLLALDEALVFEFSAGVGGLELLALLL